MKTFILVIIIITSITSNASSQWKDFGLWHPLAFGVLDTSLFVSTSGTSGRTYRYASKTGFIISDTGLGWGVVESFGYLKPTYFAGTSNKGVYRSTDKGEHWTFCRLSLDNKCFGTLGTIIFAGGGDIFRSTDSGISWTVSDQSHTGVASIVAVERTLFAATPSGVISSTDSGQSWEPTGYKTSTNALATLGSIIFAASDTGNLYRSSDNGMNWHLCAVRPFKTGPTCIATDGKHVFVNSPGVLVSNDSGITWDTASTGLPSLDVKQLCVFDSLLICSVGDGSGSINFTYARPISEMVKKDTTSTVQSVSQPPADTIEVFPNPATGLITIRSGGAAIEQVSVINLLGVDLLDLPNVRQSELTLDISRFPSGTYFLQIQTSKGNILRKVVRE